MIDALIAVMGKNLVAMIDALTAVVKKEGSKLLPSFRIEVPKS